MLATLGWPDVLVALIAGLPAIISAVAAVRVHQQVKTPSGTSIGKQVESAHITAISNNHRLTAMTKNLEIEVPVAVTEHETQIHDPINGPHK